MIKGLMQESYVIYVEVNHLLHLLVRFEWPRNDRYRCRDLNLPEYLQTDDFSKIFF
jgi:hypothetical protein